MSSKPDTYNGWTNWETWQINLWLDNEEPLYRDKQRVLRTVANYLESGRESAVHNTVVSFVRETFPTGTPDMDSPEEMNAVNWGEIVESFETEAREYMSEPDETEEE